MRPGDLVAGAVETADARIRADRELLTRSRRCIAALLALVEGGAAGGSVRDVAAGARELLDDLRKVRP